MSKITRYSGNLRAFGSSAQGAERTLFGETTQADDLTSQITASFLRGWGIVGPSENPTLEDFNAAMYALSQFIAYQHQMGIPEWDSKQEYYTGALCVHSGETYSSLADANIGSAPPSVKWTPVLTTKNGLANLGLVTNGSVGRLINIQRPSVSGTYTPTTGTKFVIVKQQAPGGNGSNSAATASGQVSCGVGGSAGGYAEFRVNISDITNFNFTIGIHAALSSSATQAGSSSFCGVTCAGGRGAAFTIAASSSSPSQVKGTAGGEVTNAGTTTLLMLTSALGDVGGNAISTVAGNAISGKGGNSHFSAGPLGVGGGNSNGIDATDGAGGSGSNGSSNPGGGFAGGLGGDGVTQFWEYA